MRKTLLTALSLLILAMACQDRPSTFEELEGVRWRMIKYTYGGNIYDARPEAVPTAAFSDGKVSGDTGCNRYFGNYKITDDNISFTGVGSTEMACPGRMEQEGQFLSLLETAQTIAIGGQQLTIHSAKGEIIFVPDTTGANVSGRLTTGPAANRIDSTAKWQIEDQQQAISGEFVYLADAALFVDCESGKKYPVAMEDAFVELEKAYLQLIGENAGQRVYAVLDAGIKPAPKTDAEGETVATVFVRKVISLTREADCSTAVRRFAGKYQFMDDVAFFTDCAGGQRYPVALAGANIELARKYAAAVAPDSTAYVELTGFLKDAPAVEGKGAEKSLFVLKVIGVDGRLKCP